MDIAAEEIENVAAIYTDMEWLTLILYMSEQVDARIASILVCFGFFSQKPNEEIIELAAGNMLKTPCHVIAAEIK